MTHATWHRGVCLPALRAYHGAAGFRAVLTQFHCREMQDPHKYRGKSKTKSAKSSRVGPKAWSKELKEKQQA